MELVILDWRLESYGLVIRGLATVPIDGPLLVSYRLTDELQ